jgi:hypothetical protein
MVDWSLRKRLSGVFLGEESCDGTRAAGARRGVLRATALALTAAVGLGACTAAGPPKAPPPPIQESIRDLGTPVSVNTTVAQAPVAPPRAPAGPPTAAVPVAPPTLPAIVTQAVEAAPSAPVELGAEAELPPARDVANGMISALTKVQTARLAARLPTGHTTDLVYVAPDRAALVEQDVNGREYAQYVIIGDTGYVRDARTGAGWIKQPPNDGYRRQTQIFRPMQIALATGQPRVLESGGEVEQIEFNGRPALRAVFQYASSAELQELGLMRSNSLDNVLEVLVDPATWLPLRTREETETGGPDKAVTEVTFVEFDRPATVDPPIS